MDREWRSSFREAFSGWLTEHGRRAGGPSLSGERTPFSKPARLDLLITVDDLGRFLEGPPHPASAVGTLRCKLLGDEPLSIVRGKIALLSEGPVLERSYYAFDELVAVAPGGATFTVSTMKTSRDGGPRPVYGDETHLPFEVRGPDGRRLAGAMTTLPTTLLATALAARARPRKMAIWRHLGVLVTSRGRRSSLG